MATKTIEATFSAAVSTSKRYTAEEAAMRCAEVVAQDWPVTPIRVNRLGASDVYAIFFKFRVPENVVTSESEVLKQAMLAGQHVAPMDSFRVHAQGVRVL